MSNTDKVVEYILGNVEKLPASKIKALAEVVDALGGEKIEEPNKVPEMDDPNLMDEQAPLDLTKVKSIMVDGKSHKVNII
jgi:hypothetical protein